MFFRCLHSNTQVDILIVLRAAIEVPTEMPTSPAMDIGEAGSAGLGVRCFRKSPVRIGLCSTSQSLFNDLFRDRERRAISRKMMNSTNKYTHYSAPSEVLEDSVWWRSVSIGLRSLRTEDFHSLAGLSFSAPIMRHHYLCPLRPCLKAGELAILVVRAESCNWGSRIGLAAKQFVGWPHAWIVWWAMVSEWGYKNGRLWWLLLTYVDITHGRDMIMTEISFARPWKQSGEEEATVQEAVDGYRSWDCCSWVRRGEEQPRASSCFDPPMGQRLIQSKVLMCHVVVKSSSLLAQAPPTQLSHPWSARPCWSVQSMGMDEGMVWT